MHIAHDLYSVCFCSYACIILTICRQYTGIITLPIEGYCNGCVRISYLKCFVHSEITIPGLRFIITALKGLFFSLKMQSQPYKNVCVCRHLSTASCVSDPFLRQFCVFMGLKQDDAPSLPLFQSLSPSLSQLYGYWKSGTKCRVFCLPLHFHPPLF